MSSPLTSWPSSTVLVVDDEEGMRNFLVKTLAPRCGQVLAAESAEAGEALVARHRFDLIVLDISLPGKPGLSWLRELREAGHNGAVILITAFADLDMAIEALRIGASDFILKPFRVTQLLNAVKHSLERERLTRENFVLRRALFQRGTAAAGLIGESPVMQALRHDLLRVAQVDSTVLLTGESGTGKELAALALHAGSERAGGPFVPVNCALMQPETIEVELFGHAPARDGLFYYAQGGTLFLDEVAELPLAAQAKLLRALEERRLRPLGSEQQIALDLRIIAASNRDLPAEVAAGRFRKDLYYRLQVVELRLPPLREHKRDIAELVDHFMAELAPRLGAEPFALSAEDLRYLQQYDWPGNVRELRNLVERSLILGSLNLSALYPQMPEKTPASATDLHTLERQHILAVLDSVQGDKGRAAQLLGISKRTLERRFAEWGAGLSTSLRHKLLAIALLPLGLVLPLLGLILLVWGDAAFDRVLITKVRSDLAVAHGYFERVQAEVGSGTRAAAESHALVQALKGGGGVAPLLAAAKKAHGLEFLNLLTPEGRLWATERGPAAADSPVQQFAEEDNPAAMLAVLAPEQLRLIAPALVERLSIAIVPTPNAAPSERRQEDRALVLVARIPVRDEHAQVLGYLQGGVLLNRNLDFIDHINEIVYPEGSLPGGSQGTATLFLDDVRISTNVRLFRTSDRAIGTRVSGQVREAVLGAGTTWLARAFVVSDWYVSAYEPLHDRHGKRIGMLYVGFLERPFLLAKYGVLAGIAAVFVAVMLAAAWFSLRLARSIFRPVERMTETMARVESGDTAARVGALPSQDELGQLAGHLDHLLGVVNEKTEALDQKVAERTRALEVAQGQLVKSEKMAAVGQLTASIAHEVNNPIAVIQGNLDLLRELLGEQAKPVAAELRLIDQQIERMRLIVTQLLQYARPTEYAGYVEAVDCAEALDSSLLLLEHQLARARISVTRDYRATRRVGINRQELQQVLINLLVNAAQAMPKGGALTLSTRDWNEHGVEVEVADTGEGLSAGMIAKLFQPFVTTKSEGTGLGLWISRSLVERYGGELRAEPGEPGARFLLCLLTEPVAPQG